MDRISDHIDLDALLRRVQSVTGTGAPSGEQNATVVTDLANAMRELLAERQQLLGEREQLIAERDRMAGRLTRRTVRSSLATSNVPRMS